MGRGSGVLCARPQSRGQRGIGGNGTPGCEALASNIAEALSYRGEIDQAFAWLDRAYQQHDADLTLINRDPLMKNLHGDRRWKAFLRRMKLPE